MGGFTSKYRKVAQDIKDKIMSGEIVGGYIFPSFRRMEKKYKVSRSVLSQAFDLLVADKYVQQNGRAPYSVPPERPANVVNSTAWPEKISPAPLSYIQSGVLIDNEFGFTRLYKSTLKKISEEISVLPYHINEKGINRLMHEISAHLSAIGIEVDKSSLMITPSVRTSNYLINMGLLSTYTTILTAKPCYIQIFPAGANSAVSYLETDDKGITLSDLHSKAKDAHNPVLYIEPLCAWPSGRAYDRQRVLEIADYCSSRQIPIIEGDFQRELWHSGEAFAPLKSDDKKGSILYMSALLSEFIPGGHLGIMAGPDFIIEHLTQVFLQITESNSYINQLVIRDLLRNGEYRRFMNRFIPALRKRCALVADLLRRYLEPYAEWEIPAGGIRVLVRFRAPIDTSGMNRRQCYWFCAEAFGPEYASCIVLVFTSCRLRHMEEFIAGLAEEAKKHA
jgi:DNA-binding transcriptional MocR family regulator